MPKPSTQFEALARDAAARIEAAREAGQQLTFLPDEPAAAAPGDRAKRGAGKATSQMRKWLQAQGMRQPEEQLAELAGLASGDDVFLASMARTEQLLAWAQTGAVGHKGAPVAPSMAQRLAAFQFVLTAALRAAEALVPYGLAKVTPDQGSPVTNVLNVYSAAQRPADAGQTARDVTPRPGRIGPPPMPHEMQQKQGLGDAASDGSDAAIRTEGPRS